MLSMKKLADERHPGMTAFDKEAFDIAKTWGAGKAMLSGLKNRFTQGAAQGAARKPPGVDPGLARTETSVMGPPQFDQLKNVTHSPSARSAMAPDPNMSTALTVQPGMGARDARPFGYKARNFIQQNPKTALGIGAAGVGGTGLAAYGMSGPNEEERYRQNRAKYGGLEEAGIPIGKFLSPEQLHTIKTAGLHKVVAAVEKVASGRNVDEITIDAAVHLLGEKAFIKRAERRRISMGLAALGKVLEA